MLSDIEIAQSAEMLPIEQVAAGLGIEKDELIQYGRYKAKLSEQLIDRLKDRPDGRLILVSAINPTPAGEGKTTTTVGLGQAMAKLNKNCVLALREPSLGPVFGIKGGAAGGGYAQVVPMEDLNLHFTGDMHAITSANNLICAMLDNHIHHGNALDIDPTRVIIKRCLDMNDRALRDIVVGLGGSINGQPRQDGFIITVASEIMAILCLSEDLDDLKARIGGILVAYNRSGGPVFARDLKAEGAAAALLKDAVLPNMVQTLENTPVIIHGGPFANIAHGCNSLRATKLALKLGDYCITEAGFGGDLGAEKFFDIKCRAGGLRPSAVVLVATVRALKYGGGQPRAELKNENLAALERGISNLGAHIDNMKKYGLPVVIAINRFADDTENELNFIADYCRSRGADFALSDVFAKGGEGGIELARAVIAAAEKPSDFAPIYDHRLPFKEKMHKIATEIYGADGVDYTPGAEKELRALSSLIEGLPVCVAKTQYSLSDDPALLGRPSGFRITVREIRPSLGAGFVVAVCGSILTMPGLPKTPAAENIDVRGGEITGLF